MKAVITFLLGLTLPRQDVRDETCLGMDGNDNKKETKKREKKRTWQEEACKAALFGADRGGN